VGTAIIAIATTAYMIHDTPTLAATISFLFKDTRERTAGIDKVASPGKNTAANTNKEYNTNCTSGDNQKNLFLVPR
jgi:hypothetical protein